MYMRVCVSFIFKLFRSIKLFKRHLPLHGYWSDVAALAGGYLNILIQLSYYKCH